MGDIMKRTPKVISMTFRVTDQLHEHHWQLDEFLVFQEDLPELKISRGDQLFVIDGVDCREKSKIEVVRMLTLLKLTQFHSITFGTKDNLDHAVIVFSTGVRLIFSSNNILSHVIPCMLSRFLK